MRAARIVYRSPWVEVPLLMALAAQTCTGMALGVRGWRRRQGFVPWLQAIYGGSMTLPFF